MRKLKKYTLTPPPPPPIKSKSYIPRFSFSNEYEETTEYNRQIS